MNNCKSKVVWWVLAASLVAVTVTGCGEDAPAPSSTSPSAETSPPSPLADERLSPAEARARLAMLVSQVRWSERFVEERGKLATLPQRAEISETLPDIAEYSLVVNPSIEAGDVSVELFITSARSGKGPLGRMVEVATAFNDANVMLTGGGRARIKIRKIDSGTGYQYLVSRKYMPDGFSPVHHLWIEMAKSSGIRMTPIRASMLKSVGGVVMRVKTADEIRERYGSLDLRSVIDSVVQGHIAMGYTNPYVSSTGLNFLVSVLSTFAQGDEQAMLSDAVVGTFEAFQRGVPFVALTTIHMRDSVRNNGALDAFIMGHQRFASTPELQSGFEFMPFGVPHEHPFYAVGDQSAEKMEVMERLAQFAERAQYQALADQYGWNQPVSHSYQPTLSRPSGDTLIAAQRIWKEKKDAGRPIHAIFLSDVSGSMEGTRMQGVKQALSKGVEFISPNNSIGLVEFSDTVQIVLPVKKFSLLHRASFIAAVQQMSAGGGTAMYDGVAKSLELLLAERDKNANAKLMLFVLTDGETGLGLKYADVAATIRGLQIPIYTIGYEARVANLKLLSGLVEAVSMNASEGQIQYKLGSLLNAQM